MFREDLREFLHDDELATDVALASGAVIRGIFTDANVDDQIGEASVVLRTEDVRRHDLTHGTRVYIMRPVTGVRTTYEIAGRQHDGTGMSDVLLRAV